jgi:hypothetical protein
MLKPEFIDGSMKSEGILETFQEPFAESEPSDTGGIIKDTVKNLGKSLLGSKYFYIGAGLFLLYVFFKKKRRD